MGVSICGRKPTSPEGENFSDSYGGWRKINLLIQDLCHDLLGEKGLHELRSEEGGPRSAAVCEQMADRFEAWMREHPPAEVTGRLLESHPQVGPAPHLSLGPFYFLGTAIRLPKEGIIPCDVHCFSKAALEKWVAFLRACGGFKVCY